MNETTTPIINSAASLGKEMTKQFGIATAATAGSLLGMIVIGAAFTAGAKLVDKISDKKSKKDTEE